jgi:NADH-quinone oxidoreductase subunit N
VLFGALYFDKMALLVVYAILIVAAMCLLMSLSNANTKGESFAEHCFLILSSATGMMIMASAADLMVMFIGLELMSLALYVLIGLGHEQKYSKEAAFKYFILGSFASALLLYGIAFVFGTAGSTEIQKISNQAGLLIGSNQLYQIGIVLIVAGLCFKLSVFPFHAWAPDVYQGAPTSVTAFMATGVKLVLFTVFLRMAMGHFFWGHGKLALVLQILAGATMLIGNLSALLQENVKRIFAYSSVAHAGYMMVGIIAASNSAAPDAAASVLFYVLTYCAMNLGVFAVISVIEREERGHLHISDYAGLGFRYPFLGIALTILVLSMAGMPPTVGFLSKFYVFSAAVGEGYLWLVLWGVFNSLLSAYYYLRIVVNLYMSDPVHEVGFTGAFGSRFVIGAMAALTLIFGVVSQLIYTPVISSVKTYFTQVLALL